MYKQGIDSNNNNNNNKVLIAIRQKIVNGPKQNVLNTETKCVEY